MHAVLIITIKGSICVAPTQLSQGLGSKGWGVGSDTLLRTCGSDRHIARGQSCCFTMTGSPHQVS